MSIKEIEGGMPDQAVFNFDQSGFRINHWGNPTLSFEGERTTKAQTEGLNYLTHSYTIQPVVNRYDFCATVSIDH